MKIQEFIQILFEIEINAHIAHLQAKNRSYAEHMALGTLYEEIVDLRDRFVESYQGNYQIVEGYNKTFNVKEGIDLLYLRTTRRDIEVYRASLKDGYLQQIIDDIIELLNSTIYKLNYLK